jgi:DNA helicase-2/ATP-dependent DNA helicase PcrA
MTTRETPLWKKCEDAWAAYLASSGHLVTRLADAHGRDGEVKAPLMQMGADLFRAPDLLSQKAGITEYWEVKQRAAAMINRVTGESEYWVANAAFQDYYAIARQSGATVWMILRDSEIWSSTRKWLQANVVTIFNAGHQGIRRDAGGEEISAWIWPSSAMKLVDGPEVESFKADAPLLVREGNQDAVRADVLELIEKELRSPRVQPAEDIFVAKAGVVDLLRENSRVGLEVLRRSLGIPDAPRYSVMRVGLAGQDLDEILGLVRYGIRVFLVADTEPQFGIDKGWVEAYKSSRLLEWAVIPGADKYAGWVVDGAIEETVRAFVSRASADQPFNYHQYMIVHSSHLGHVFVRAGAGTGKTATMAERIMFLLATSSLHADPRDESLVYNLRLDEIVLVTFTREAAREMRTRIATTLMLRQRLCDKCVLPTIAWLMELSNTEIETIHTYSKKLIQREGSRIGLGPGFAVGELTMEFRREVKEALSPLIDAIFSSQSADDVKKVPAAYQFEKFVESLWEKLSGNGLSPLTVGATGARTNVVWGSPPEGLEGQVADAVRRVVEQVAKTFSEVCERNQVIPVSELVSTAARAVTAIGQQIRRAPRYLFVDEFQDTDSEQIQMVLTVCACANASLFAVGDVKQGIYRFRGASGNAFQQLQALAAQCSLNLRSYTLTQNFRSGKTLLDDLHLYFLDWGRSKYLEYDKQDRLQAARDADRSEPVSLTPIAWGAVDDYVVTKVRTWLREFPEKNEKIAVLCRNNDEAYRFMKALRASHISCEVRTRGDFFRSDAVIELRVFLEAVLNPADDAALLELCTTRWFTGLATMAKPVEIRDIPNPLHQLEQVAWANPLPPILTWAERLGGITNGGRFDKTDLELVRARVVSLAELLEMKPVLGWLMDCNAWMQPRTAMLPGEDQSDSVERLRYSRCFDHLITLLDESFADAPISPYRLLEWLRLKIATDRTEDEPDPTEESETRVTVLTVHKAKGLEYDCVLIPGTANKFVSDSGRSEEFAFVSENGSARVLWKWRPGYRYTNVRPSDSGLWSQEVVERVREETRLLYVAMTRAREALDIVITTRGDNGALPNSWVDLLELGEVDDV